MNDTLSIAYVHVSKPTSEPWLTLDYDEWMCVKEGVFLLFLLILFWIVVLKGIRFVDFGFLPAHCTQEEWRQIKRSAVDSTSSACWVQALQCLWETFEERSFFSWKILIHLFTAAIIIDVIQENTSGLQEQDAFEPMVRQRLNAISKLGESRRNLRNLGRTEEITALSNSIQSNVNKQIELAQ